MDTWNRTKGYTPINTSGTASHSIVGGFQSYYIAPLCVPSKNIFPTASGARSKAVGFLYNLHKKAHDSADRLEVPSGEKTSLPNHRKRLSSRTMQILESLSGFDFIDPDSLDSHYLEDYFGDLGRLILALEMFSSAEMCGRTGKKVDRATLDVILMTRDAEEARDLVKIIIMGTMNAREQIQAIKLEHRAKWPEPQGDGVRKPCYAVDEGLYIKILNMLAPAKPTFRPGVDDDKSKQVQKRYSTGGHNIPRLSKVRGGSEGLGNRLFKRLTQ